MNNVGVLDLQQHNLIGEIIADSFSDDPVNRWVFGNRACMTGYYSLVAKKLYLPKGTGNITHCENGGALWLPPNVPNVIPLYKSLDIAATMLKYHGFKSLKRGIILDNALAKAKPREPHFYLFAIGVRPAAQNRGLGAALMQHGLKIVDKYTMPAYLESSKEINVPFYQRFGFEVVEKISSSEEAPPLWLMWREAR